MLLGGQRVHPLWQTPFLPLLYVLAASFMSFGCVAGVTMLCCLVWKRPIDRDVLEEAARITAWIIFGWLAIRNVDLLFRGSLFTAFHFTRYAGIFWIETLLIGYGGWLLLQSLKDRKLRTMFLGYTLSSVGGMLYRFSPTTLAYMPGPHAMYFPSVIELLIAMGFVATGVAAFLVMVKLFAILPAPVQEWHNMAIYFKARRPYSNWTKYFNFGFFGDTESTESD